MIKQSYVFYCANCLDADQFAGFCRRQYGDSVKTVSLPCSGKLDVPYLTKAFETGADGVVIVTCQQRECRHFEGNLRAQKRAQAVAALLEEIGMGTGRLAVIQCDERGVGQVSRETHQFLETVKHLPPVTSPVAAPQPRAVA